LYKINSHDFSKLSLTPIDRRLALMIPIPSLCPRVHTG
jgi:hypothetical protein